MSHHSTDRPRPQRLRFGRKLRSETPMHISLLLVLALVLIGSGHWLQTTSDGTGAVQIEHAPDHGPAPMAPQPSRPVPGSPANGEKTR